MFMEKKPFIFISIVFILTFFSLISFAEDSSDYSVTIANDYDFFTLNFEKGSFREFSFDVTSEDESIAKVGFVITQADNYSVTIAGIPVSPGKTRFLIKPSDSRDPTIPIPITVPREGDNDSTSSIVNAISIIDEKTIGDIISSCPSLSKLTKDTKDYYKSLSDYKKAFPNQDGNIHTWMISIQKGVVSFSDEKQMTVLTMKPSGTASEMASILKWEIYLLESLPSIKKSAESNGVKLIVEKRVSGGDYAEFANDNGVIDLMIESKYNDVLNAEHNNLSMMEVVKSFDELDELDKNGNGVIDFDELFK